MRAVFSAIDADGDERLDAGEVHRAAAALGLSVAPEEADRMIALLDGDDDGKISFSEFRRFCVLLPGAFADPCLSAQAGVRRRMLPTSPLSLPSLPSLPSHLSCHRAISGGLCGLLAPPNRTGLRADAGLVPLHPLCRRPSEPHQHPICLG